MRRTALLLLICSRAWAQGSIWSEVTVGSEQEQYLRALSLRAGRADNVWIIRPFAPGPDSLVRHPWEERFAATPSQPRPQMLRPSVRFSSNSAFPWSLHDGAVWQGKGITAWSTAGVAARWGRFHFRLEPLATYAANRPFTLDSVAGSSANQYVDDMRPLYIDLPQRFGERPLQHVSPGQSHVRFDARNVAVAFSTENVHWGPGYRNAMLLGAEGEGFPHLTIGTARPMRTPVGAMHGQLLYGQLDNSTYAPTNPANVRFASGFAAVWTPFSLPMELGITRFFHSQWPRDVGLGMLLKPLSLKLDTIGEQDTVNVLPPDNQLGSVFLVLRAPGGGFEVFGEFGRNDRASDLRDLVVEPEHNSAWAIGGMATWATDADRSFWALRAEFQSGRIASIAQLGRPQATLYQHATWTQGHTVGGQLLGSPLLERATGLEASLDRWTPWGRAGFVFLERQMPEDAGVGVREAAARSQWYIEANALAFLRSGDLSVALGRVLDVNRLPGRDARNVYARLGWHARIR